MNFKLEKLQDDFILTLIVDGNPSHDIHYVIPDTGDMKYLEDIIKKGWIKWSKVSKIYNTIH